MCIHVYDVKSSACVGYHQILECNS
jgi:hypothetical protein